MEFREHARGMGLAAGVFWMHRDLGSHVEGMAIGSPNPRVWPENIVERLGAVGEVLYNALYRRQDSTQAPGRKTRASTPDHPDRCRTSDPVPSRR